MSDIIITRASLIDKLVAGKNAEIEELQRKNDYLKSHNASLLHQLELKDKEIAMLQANITNISKL